MFRYVSFLPALAVSLLLGASPAFGSSFGFQSFEGSFTGPPPESLPDTQAGSHPYEVTVRFALNSSLVEGHNLTPVGGDIKDLEVELPPGLIGDPDAAPQCTRQELDTESCPASTQIGEDTTTLGGAGNPGGLTVSTQVYNMVPPLGVPAQFALIIQKVRVFLDASVRSGGDYGITENSDDLPQLHIVSNSITLWGVSSHEGFSTPFLIMPTSCTGPLTVTAHANTWQDVNTTAEASFQLPAITGCERLSFEPSIEMKTDTAQAGTPTGLRAEVATSQEALLDLEDLPNSTIKDTTVTLPEGLVINPGEAAGLEACQEAQAALRTEGLPSCPAASKVGEDEIETPLLKDTLKGDVYVLQSNPPEVRLLVEASADGVDVKLVGEVHLNETTGRLTTTFKETPELPFTSFRLSFSGGAQAALVTPPTCGSYMTSTDFTPWSSPFVGDAFPSSNFAIASGTGGGPCPALPLPFSPSMIAGSTTDQAGGFTSFSLLLQNGDGQQRIEKLQFKEPAGLSGMISSVPLCPEPEAAQGTCSSASQIGHASVASGPGPYPLAIPQPGDPESPIYLTGPYEGAPFGLSIVTHAIAGPFNLGTIITRAKVEVDPHTAQITVTTDPLPQVVAGVPTDLRLVNSVIDRPEFLFNPTNCNPSSFSGTAYGTPPPGVGGPGASAPIESHFQVGSCRSLEFAPKFSVTTSGKTSKAAGASLTAKVSYPNAPQGAQADIGSVKVELPKQLPSRLTTLQKACTDAQFEANPADCPPASFIGRAVVHTPVLPVPLTGPVIFVSHGGEAFPSLTMVLQGDGVAIDLVGTTFISKAGVTSTTFKAVPDQPFSTFELILPEGPYSALAANGNLCASKLVMPNEFVGQNGAVIKRTTNISVTGCTKAKTLTRAQKLAAALKACRRKSKGKRAGCEKRARAQYGSVKKRSRQKTQGRTN